MNDTLGDDPGHSDIQQQDLISDDVANAITSAINGDEMDGSATPPTTVKPSHPAAAPTSGAPTTPAEPTATPAPHEEPQQDLPTPVSPAPPEPAPASPPAADIIDRGSGNVSELYDIKQSALKQLSPLVQHLEQGPEEKFETLIMMVRASDDPALIRPSYEAAQAIPDEKRRAQALLDVVNEVNYLTRPTED